MDDDFDPFNPDQQYGDFERMLAKLEPAWAKAALYFRSEGNWHYGHGPHEMRMQGLLDIWTSLEIRRKGYEAGNTIEILHAIKECAAENLPMPTWLAQAFDKQFSSILRPGGPTMLDEVFTSRGAPKTANKKRQLNRDWQIAGKLWKAAWDAARKDKTIQSMDAALVKISGTIAAHGVGKTKARQLIEMVDKNQARLLPKYHPFSEFLAKRRKP